MAPSTGTLPHLRPSKLRQLIWFDVTTGQPLAVKLLFGHLGAARFARLLPRLAVRSIRDPLRAVDHSGWPRDKDRQTRRQLRPVLALHAALLDIGVAPEEALAITGDVVAQVGARFIGANVVLPDPDQWAQADDRDRHRYVGQVIDRLFNAEVAAIEVSENSLGFDVTACRFAHLTEAAGYPELAPLFCEADGAHFERKELPIRLRRSGTIARGAKRCDFRFAVTPPTDAATP
jgi:hypothetical protein